MLDARVRALLGVSLCAAVVVAGLVWSNRAIEQLPAGMRADSLVVDKATRRLTVFAEGRAIKQYRVALGRGGAAAKREEGDLLVPEGRYAIDSRLERSAFHRALHVSYPDSQDIARAARAGVAPGHSIMVHGIRNGLGWIGRAHRLADWTAGCIAVTNPEIEELWRVTADGTPITIR